MPRAPSRVRIVRPLSASTLSSSNRYAQVCRDVVDISIGADRNRSKLWAALGIAIGGLVLGILLIIVQSAGGSVAAGLITGILIILLGIVIGGIMALQWFLQEVLNGGVYVVIGLCKCAVLFCMLLTPSAARASPPILCRHGFRWKSS